MKGPLRSQGGPQSLVAPVRVLLKEDVYLTPGREYLVQGIIDCYLVNCDAIFSPHAIGLSKRNILAANAIVNISKSSVPVRLVNIGENDIKLYQNTQLGYIEHFEQRPYRVRQMNVQSQREIQQKVKTLFQKSFSDLQTIEASKLKEILGEFIDVFSVEKMDIGCAKGVFH
jgi:hypothetical protein